MTDAPTYGPQAVMFNLSRAQALDLRFALRDAANGARGAALVMDGRQSLETAASLRQAAERYDELLASISPALDAVMPR